ncbi:glucosaminidase domain-containing protein [Priestia megaterium]
MKILQSSDYRIYFDDVRMDPYIKIWNAECGLRLSDATASITMYRTKELEEWKGYLTQVRIFARNVFSGKFAIVFEGEIMNRSWGDARTDTGEITFQCKGFYHWLDIPIPFLIGQEESFDYIQRFRYEAQNIDVEGMASMQSTKAELMMKDKAIEELIKSLFDIMSKGYHMSSDSTYTWAKLEDRFKVMSEVIKEFRDAGYLDSFTFVRSTQIESFYVYLNQVLQQMMFEFYQDRDGAFRIKTPSWSDQILKAHILDEAVVAEATGFNDWENEPTRVLAIGGQQDIARRGHPSLGAGNIMKIPMGLYIGLPGEGEYFSQVIEVAMAAAADTGGMVDSGGGGGEGIFGSDGMFQSTGVADGPAGGVKWPKLSHPLISGQTNIHPILMERLVKLSQANGNKPISITDGGRTYAQQVDVKRRKPNLAATPGKSNHEIGTAVDVGPGWLRPLRDGDLAKYGLYKSAIGKGEDWHIDLIENKGRSNTDTIKVLGGLSPRGQAASSGGSSGGDMSNSSNTGSSLPSGSGSTQEYVNQNLRNQSNWSAAQLNQWINGRAPKDGVMYNRGAAFAEAAKQSGLDPIYIVAHAAHETGWGRSNIAKKKYNFFGIAAFDSSPFSSASTWSGPDAGIIQGAVWIRKNYYDKGQQTLYTMRFSPSGKHNYATDPGWHTKIADIMKGSGTAAGAQGGSAGAIQGGSGGGGGNIYIGTPYAATGGYTFTTRYVSSDLKVSTSLKDYLKDLNTPKPVDVHSFANSKLTYGLPKYGKDYKPLISSRPNGINANLLCVVIEETSSWKEKYKSGDHYGLMGVPKNYIVATSGIGKNNCYDAEVNVKHGTLLMSKGLSKFSKKYTFAIATLYLGETKPLEDAVKKAGSTDFSVVRNHLDKSVGSYVDKIINKYTSSANGNMLKDDPHRTFVQSADTTAAQAGGLGGGSGEYQSSYKPIMSDEERLYKVNLKVSEQLLIRYDIQNPTAAPTDQTNTDNADSGNTDNGNTDDSQQAQRSFTIASKDNPISFPGGFEDQLKNPIKVTDPTKPTPLPGLEDKPKDGPPYKKPDSDKTNPGEDSGADKPDDGGSGGGAVTPPADEKKEDSNSTLNADVLIELYAKYIMQLYRAESHSLSVALSTCMPFLRPGYNAWLEPTRRDMVFYITKVSHNGSFQQGAFSTVSGGFVRSAKDYDDIEDNIFVGKSNAKASDFGEVIEKKNMDAMRKELKTLHDKSDEVIEDARRLPTLSRLYSSAVGKENDYTTSWNNEFTSNDLHDKIVNWYEGAPPIVKERKKKLKGIVDKSADFFVKMLLKTNF